MRLLVIVLTILLLVNVLGFVLTNLETLVEVTVWNTQHRDVPLFAVVMLSVLAGIVYAGVIAVAEGANLRIENRRLRQEIQRIETEHLYLRAQSSRTAGAEPDAILDRDPEPGAGEAAGPGPAAETPASAPVYDADGYGWEDDPANGPYSGGRAV